jgi:hypothetical protein
MFWGEGDARAKSGWSRKFNESISLPGRVLVTLHDAADYTPGYPRKKPPCPNGKRRSRRLCWWWS